MHKKIILMVLCLVFLVGSSLSVVSANPVSQTNFPADTITVTNQSGHDLYVYDYDLSVNRLSPIKLDGSSPTSTDYTLLDPGKTIDVVMQPNAGTTTASHRIYVADNRMSNSLETGVLPDAFNPSVDGNNNYSFVEYNLNKASGVYSVDVSYVDEMSFPISMMFRDVPTSYTSAPGGCDNGFLYGVTSKQALENALKAKGAVWGDLIWHGTQPNQANVFWSPNIRRIVGPNKIWPQQNSLAATMPTSMVDFAQQMPWNGNQLCSQLTNLQIWLGDLVNSRPYPEINNSGWVQAFHSVSPKDSHGKYGYYTSPKDDTSGLFDNVPLAGHLSVIVNPD